MNNSMTDDNINDMMSIINVANETDRSVGTIQRWCKSGDVVAQKFHGVWMVSKQSVVAFINAPKKKRKKPSRFTSLDATMPFEVIRANTKRMQKLQLDHTQGRVEAIRIDSGKRSM